MGAINASDPDADIPDDTGIEDTGAEDTSLPDADVDGDTDAPDTDDAGPDDADVVFTPDTDTSSDPCDGEDCSNNGSCELDGGEPYCDCNTGYEPGSGLSCVEEDDPCDGITCSNNGNCIDDGGSAHCNCFSNYNTTAGGTDCVHKCDDGEINYCDYWVLSSGSSQWSGYRYDSSGLQNPPSGDVKAAFDIEHHDRAYIFTDNRFYRADLSGTELQWDNDWTLSQFDGNLSSYDEIVAAYSVAADTAGGAEEIIMMARNTSSSTMMIWVKDYSPSSSSFTSKHEDPNFDWTSDHGNQHAPDHSDIRVSWVEVDNATGWVTGDPSEMCDEAASSSEEYNAFLTSNQAHILDQSACQDAGEESHFYDPILLSSFSPFQSSTNPPSMTHVGAGFLNQGSLYLFRGN